MGDERGVDFIAGGGSLTLAVLDPSYRPFFADLAKVGLGGYLGQLIPQIIRRDE
ncbi:MAG: hypothetical protein Q6K90_04065 [Gloeomargarita sp. HHBFW_bins_162]